MGSIPKWLGQIIAGLTIVPDSKGHQAEQLAARYLQDHGLSLEASNYRTPLGEIDLICKDQDQLVFVEVRYKANQAWASPAESVTRSKQLKLIKAARQYLQQHDPAGHLSCRFDVVAMTGDIKAPVIDWLPNAFY